MQTYIMIGLIFFLAVLVLVFFLKVRKYKGDYKKAGIEFWDEYKDTFKKIFDIAFDVYETHPKDRTEKFLEKIGLQWRNGYFKTDLEGLKKVLLNETSCRVTNTVDRLKVEEFIKKLEQVKSYE